MSIFNNGRNLQIRGIDKDEGKDKHNAIALNLEVVFLGNFQKLISLSKITSFFQILMILAMKYFSL